MWHHGMVQKELRKLTQSFWKGFLKWYDGGRENGITSKRIFEVEVSFFSQNINFHFIWRDSWSFAFSSSLFFCSVNWGLGCFDDIWAENQFFKNFFLNGFNILAVDTYSGMELCMPTWLNLDYGDGGIVDILAVTHILEWSYACQYFWVRLASNVGSKSFLKKSSKLK
jgi:hypothetical protein